MSLFPQDQNFWYLQRPETQPLRTDKQTDVVVIGGGMAGLSAADAFARKGKKVIVVEAYYCGAGATGKSSGFIGPNAELGLTEMVERYGKDAGKTIWEMIIKDGVDYIRNNISTHNLACDYTEQDSLEVATTQKDLKTLYEEAEQLHQFGYESTRISQSELAQYLTSKSYHGGITYPHTFGMSAYKYCQGMKNVLISQGVEIYEETPALTINEHSVTTAHGTIEADHIIVCADRSIPDLGKLTDTLYHFQNFIIMSQPLSQQQIQAIFPAKRYMVWDTELIYNYYRMTQDRLLFGGGSLLYAYRSNESHTTYMYTKLRNSLEKAYPGLNIQFEQMWSGLIGVSKDIAPLTGTDKDVPSIYYIGGTAGLPVAAMLGNYAAEVVIDKADTLRDYFSPYRSFAIQGPVQNILGKKISFALSHLITHGL